MEDNFIINYNLKTLQLFFEGEFFNFYLEDGDVGDFWNSITLKDGTLKDINFAQENEEQEPTVSVYGVKKNDEGKMMIDTKDAVYISKHKAIGNSKEYFV